MVILLFISFDVAHHAADAASLTTSIECDSEGFKEIFEDICYEDANFEKALFICTYPTKNILPTPSFLLVSELTSQVWQPPKI